MNAQKYIGRMFLVKGAYVDAEMIGKIYPCIKATYVGLSQVNIWLNGSRGHWLFSEEGDDYLQLLPETTQMEDTRPYLDAITGGVDGCR